MGETCAKNLSLVRGLSSTSFPRRQVNKGRNFQSGHRAVASCASLKTISAFLFLLSAFPVMTSANTNASASAAGIGALELHTLR
jgi:hypothetical protein